MNHFRPRVFFIIISIFIISLVSVGTAHASVPSRVPLGSIPVSVTLNPSVTYVVEGQNIVDAGATLTIPAGTHLVFTPGARLSVHGSVIAKGTASKHIVIEGGASEPFIPFAAPLNDSASVQAPEAQALQASESQTPATVPTTIEDTVMHADAADTLGKHDGIEMYTGATGTFSYIDISGATEGLRIDVNANTTVSVDHAVFADCNLGIEGITGGLKLTNSSFANVTMPAEVLFPFAFTHSNTAFSGSGFNGWRISTALVPGDAVKLNSTDGEYDISGMNVAKDSSLTISPGVTAFIRDGTGVQVVGKLIASGTADKPIVIYGDGACSAHSPAISFSSSQSAIMGHVNFKNLCSGISASHSTLTMTNDSFDTIAGTAVRGMDLTTVNASAITMHDIYQAFDIENVGHLALSNATISLVNGNVPAIKVSAQSPLSGKTISIDGASTCIAVMGNSSITASGLTLAHCSVAGIASDNDSASSPSGIALTNSEISHSGTALKLNFARITNVSNNSFHDNTIGVSLSNMPKTTIINNSWGSNRGPRIESNPGGDGDSIVTGNVPEVVYRPWLGMTTEPQAGHNPIIIVPGITGTVLNQDYGSKGELWPNLTQLALSITDSFLEELKLLLTGKQNPEKPMKTGDVIRSVSSTDVFGGMIASFTQNGYTEGTDLFVLPYDWRLSNADNQSLLKDAVANALAKSGKSKVNIVAHSMGGLLVKDYLAENADAPIDHLFYIGVPHLGAPKAFQTLMYGDDMGFKFPVGPIRLPLLNSDMVKAISQNMPSVYELLPSEKYISKFGAYVRDDNQANRELGSDATKSLMVGDGRNAAMFPFAKSLHDATDAIDGTRYSTYDFAGCGSTKAVNSFTLTTKRTFEATAGSIRSVPEHRIYYAKGDGVVPVKSATAELGATNYYVTSGSHGTLPHCRKSKMQSSAS